MTAQPLSKTIYNKAKELGVTMITLHFSGGNDEGHLSVDIHPHDKYDSDFETEVEDWAWEAYDYNGAGDGNDYGDDITYNLETNQVSTEEWYHVVERNNGGLDVLEIADEIAEDEEE